MCPLSSHCEVPSCLCNQRAPVRLTRWRVSRHCGDSTRNYCAPISRPLLRRSASRKPQYPQRRHRWGYQRTGTKQGKRGIKMQYKKHRGHCKCVSFAPHGRGSEHSLTRDSDARVVTNLHTTSPTFPVCFLYYFPRPPPPLYRNTPPFGVPEFLVVGGYIFLLEFAHPEHSVLRHAYS